MICQNYTQTPASGATEPQELSDTILEALDLTMPADSNISVPLSPVAVDDDSVDGNGDESGVDEVNSDDENDYEAIDADESITLLKQPVTAESSADEENLAAPSNKSTNKKHKCCESCAVNLKSKKKLGMIQCNVCMSWFHEQCVGLDKDSEPVGIWLCMTCREFPKTVTAELAVMRNELYGLKQSTTSILTAVKSLTSSVERSIGNINDRITAINKQMSTNDKSITGTLQTLATSTNNIKTSVDQKSCQILNKTSAILDKVKTTQTKLSKQNTTTETPHETNALIENRQQVPSTRISSSNPRQGQRSGAPNNVQEQKRQQSNKGQTNKDKKEQTNQKPTHENPNDPQETIDLTKNTKPLKTMKHATLLAGSSLLKKVNTNQLNADTTVRSFSGATIDSLKSKLSEYNLDQCKTVLLLVGGNDADDDIDLETFAQKYEALLTDMMTHDRRVIVVGLLPRKTVDLNPYNDRLRTLCETYEVEYIDNFKSFLLASGEIPDSYYQSDKVHLNNFALRRLLSNIDRFHTTMSKSPVQNNERQFNNPQSGFRRPNRAPGYAKGRQFVQTFCQICSRDGHATRECRANGAREYARGGQHVAKFCHICSRDGHDTRECWFNGRNNGRSDRNVR